MADATRNDKFQVLSSKFQDLMPKRKLIGIIVSNKMQKTVVVEVERIKKHPKYERRYKSHKRYKAHDEKGEYKTGERVVIEESRPISKDKRWRVVAKI